MRASCSLCLLLPSRVALDVGTAVGCTSQPQPGFWKLLPNSQHILLIILSVAKQCHGRMFLVFGSS